VLTLRITNINTNQVEMLESFHNLFNFINRNAKGTSYSFSIGGICFQSVGDVSDFGFFVASPMTLAVFSNKACCCSGFISLNNFPVFF